ncbi:hypothetical protein RRF57_003442 [Xylaria bambusicola]|uniref:Uncharacterized protein n=1 Tax=Xylaria bambusicola TaxID=326684 RepID=A0AAN7Z3F7_9PEZI
MELERNARLSAKLLELAAAPKPERADSESMKIIDEDADATGSSNTKKDDASTGEDTMDIDAAKSAVTSNKSSRKKSRIEKRKKTSKIVFPKYGDKARRGKTSIPIASQA